jgi:CRP/FNR family transcriptional regulator
MNQVAFSPGTCWKCDNCVVHNRSICRAGSDEDVSELCRMSHIREFEKGQVIIAQGDASKMVGNVVAGIVKLTNMSVSGQQQIVGLLFPSDFFGRVYSDHSRFSFEAATDVTLCCIDSHAFEHFLERHRDIEHELLFEHSR